MKRRRIYVDIDDVLSRTVERLIDLLDSLHGRRIELDDALHFDLSKTFSLDEDEIREFMDHAHSDEWIGSIAPVTGASQVLDRWGDAGDVVALVTGRPPMTNAASQRWLEEHGLRHESLHHLDKWNRPDWNLEGLPAIGFHEIEAFGFDFAVEDSLDTAIRLVEEFELPVALMDRPWNRDLSGVSRPVRSRLVRCASWADVSEQFD